VKFERFSAKNDIFNRVDWDHSYSTPRGRAYLRSLVQPGRIGNKEGYAQPDMALRNGGWTLANHTYMSDENRKEGFHSLLTPWGRKHPQMYQASAQELTNMLKRASGVYGIEKIGVTAINLDYHHSHRYDHATKSEIPAESMQGLDHCVVVANSMSYDLVQTYPSATAGAAPGHGYSQLTFQAQTLVQFIRQLGYDAVASVNDTAQCIPYAIQAGLGEYGRNGLLINPELGPRLRIGKIFTNMPLVYDHPHTFGVSKLCQVCRKCTTSCPPKAIPNGAPSYQVYNISNIRGVKKWTVDAEKCYSFWSKQLTECGICMRVCPFNKDLTRFWHRIYYKWIFQPLLQAGFVKTLLFVENMFEFDRRLKPNKWWNQ